MQPIEIEQETERARRTFHDLVEGASTVDLRRPSHGTRWTNRQLLWHTAFGYLIARTLLPLARSLAIGVEPSVRQRPGRRARRLFHLINYSGSCVGGQLFTPAAMARLLDRTIHVLQQQLRTAGPSDLALTDHLGPLLRLHHERLPLRHPTLRAPPAPTHRVCHGNGVSGLTR